MQISLQEVVRARQDVGAGKHDAGFVRAADERPVGSLEELAERNGVRMEEVRRFTERALMAEEDPGRERRVRELARRVAEGTYRVDAEQVLDMAERRALADRSSHL